MKAVVKYIDFHIDNYQGASGKTVKGRMFVDVPNDLICEKLFAFIDRSLDEHLKERRPFGVTERGYRPTIVSVELL